MYPHILIYVYVVINLNCYTLSRYVDPLEPGLLFGWPAVNPFFSKKSLTKRRDLVRSCRWLVGAIPRPWWCWDHHPEGKRSLKTLGFCNHVMNNSLSGKSNSIQHSVYIYICIIYICDIWYQIIIYYTIILQPTNSDLPAAAKLAILDFRVSLSHLVKAAISNPHLLHQFRNTGSECILQ